jgi:type VI secretion system protein ImpE
MTAKELFDAGRVKDAASSLAALLRERPTDTKARTFLFELLCFSGQYDRAEKHLSLLAEGSKEHELGAVLYYSALHAERMRHDLFRKEEFPKEAPAPSPKGTLNGKPFDSISDLDPQIGARLELFAAGAYTWVPFCHVKSIQVQPVKRLRETLWTPAFVLAGPTFQGADMGEVIIPAIYPFSWNSSDESLWLGRGTEWVSDQEGHEFPVGQKVFVVDGEEVPLLEVREIQFAVDEIAADAIA